MSDAYPATPPGPPAVVSTPPGQAEPEGLTAPPRSWCPVEAVLPDGRHPCTRERHDDGDHGFDSDPLPAVVSTPPERAATPVGALAAERDRLRGALEEIRTRGQGNYVTANVLWTIAASALGSSPVVTAVTGTARDPVPLPLGEYARQLEAQLAEAGRELIRLASAERDAREERDDLARRIAEVAPMLDELRRMGGQLEGQRAALEEEQDKLARSCQLLARVASDQGRAMYAAWIDAERGDHKAAKETITQQVEQVLELHTWNGTETGTQWLERTDGEENEDDAAETASVLADPETMAAIAEGDPDPSVLRDLLLLAGEDIPLNRITGWTPEERAQVAEWAGREHLSASDNPVARRPRPSLLGGDGA